MKKLPKLEGCGCFDCQETRDKPCHFDCDYDEMCQGCAEAAEIEADETNMETDWAALLR